MLDIALLADNAKNIKYTLQVARNRIFSSIVVTFFLSQINLFFLECNQSGKLQYPHFTPSYQYPSSGLSFYSVFFFRLTFSCAWVWGISQFSSFQKSFSVRHFDCQWIPPQYQPVRQRWKVQGSLFTRFKFENICSIQTDCADVKRGHQLTRVSGYLVNTCISQISKIFINSRRESTC